MELWVIVVALCVLGPLAARFGVDSTPGLSSQEEEAAATGMTWDVVEVRLSPGNAAGAPTSA